MEPFLVNALVTGTCAAVCSGVVGVFVVLRSASFAAHALAQIAFAGAAGAVLVGVDPLWGLIAFAVGGGTGLGFYDNVMRRDAWTGLVMTAALGLGSLFLALTSSYATAAYALLFGSMVGISREDVFVEGTATVAILGALAVLFRPLLFVSVCPGFTSTRGLPERRLGIAFVIVLGLASAAIVPIVGTLLVFALVVAPPAAACRLATSPYRAIGLSVTLNAACVWVGMYLAYQTLLPVGFTTATTACAVYVAARLLKPAALARAAGGLDAHSSIVI